MTKWIDPTPVEIPESLLDLGLHPLAAQTLVRRGIAELSAAKAFLDPNEYTPTDGWELPDLRTAVDRVEQAILKSESICVWGDFDVDGQTSTALLVQTLRALGANVHWHIPLRATESHGIKIPYLKEVIDNGAELILTCDTGVGEYDAIEYANSRGIDVVITDHHDLPEILPNALAVVDPKRLPDEHPLATLPGVGVAYKLAEKLLESREEENSSRITHHDLLDLVALGITADVADLQGDARYLLQRGLIELRQTKRIGLQTLYELAGINPLTVNEGDIGFGIAPRMNAIGRLGDANIMVDFLTTENPSQARVIATQLEGLNTQRRLLTSQIYQAAEAQIRDNPTLKENAALVLAQKDWPAGVIGITASRLGERYRKPVILLSVGEDGKARGSARSVAGIHITEAIAAQKDILHGFGGHPMAAGMALDADKIPAFRRRISKTITQNLGTEKLPEATLLIDAWLPLKDLSLALSADLNKLAPFGPRNRSLILASHDLTLANIAKIGRNKEHIRLTVKDREENHQTILWWNAADEEHPEKGSRFDLAFKMRTGEYKGQPQLTLEMVDFRVTVEVKRVESSEKKIEVVDFRLKSEAFKGLKVEGLQVFVEGNSEIIGKNRYQLKKSEELALYTSPPGQSELRAMLKKVKPQKVYLIGIDPPEFTPQAFLSHLAGLVKYALTKKDGQTNISTLAAVTAQREATIRLGLEWLAAGGQVVVDVDGDEVKLTKPCEGLEPSQGSGEYAQADLFLAIKGLLAETIAFREHFQITEKESLME
ncbi:MAG: single-stranded-DNA-specific exonuclease RecJ [Chloroflexi bacterium]|nr:single-stranded-DNA-specific exonuclease RecJ [Chloroflexota bacterium]